MIEVYYCNGKPLSKITGPRRLEADYLVDKEGVSFHKRIPYAYMNAVSDGDYIYATYIGQYYIPGKNSLESFDSYIIRFDWDGNPMNVYHLPFYSKTITAHRGNLFVRSISEGNPVLIKIMPACAPDY